MSKNYRILKASNQYPSFVIEELESQANDAAREGYRLNVQSIRLFWEDRGPNEVTICHAVAVMEKNGSLKKS